LARASRQKTGWRRHIDAILCARFMGR
jgi:hypothetical protein